MSVWWPTPANRPKPTRHMTNLPPSILEHAIVLSSVEHAIHSLFPLPVLAVLLWYVGRRSGLGAAWNTRVDLGLALATGMAVALLSSVWMPRFYLAGAPLAASDFGQYCSNVGQLRDGVVDEWIMQRSMAAGVLPALLARMLGIVDGLLAASIISVGVLGAAVYLWARALHSRLAGLVGALSVCAIAPLVTLARTVTFYPEIVASYMMCGATTALALRLRTLPAILAAAIGIGWVLLVDVRGLIWALPALALVGVAVSLLENRRMQWVAAGLIAVSLTVSFLIAHVTQWGLPPSIEQHAVHYVDEALRRASPDNPEVGIQFDPRENPTSYVWGHTSPHHIPTTLATLWSLNALLTDSIANTPENRIHRQIQIMPWVWPALFGLLCSIWALRRRRLLLLGMLVSMMPFGIALNTAGTALAHARYIATGICIVPVLLGVGFAAIHLGPLPSVDSKRTTSALSWVDGLACALVLLLVIGTIPSWLSPSASWRLPISADVEPGKSLWHASKDAPLPPSVNVDCAAALRADFQEGLPVGSRLLGWTIDTQPIDHNPIDQVDL